MFCKNVVPKLKMTKYTHRFQIQAFTLVEVMLVLAIMVVIASLSLQFTSGVLSNYRIRQSSEDIRAEWRQLRIQAMDDGHVYCFRFAYGENSYRVDRILDAHYSAKFDSPDRSQYYGDDPLLDKTIDPDELNQQDYYLPDPEWDVTDTTDSQVSFSRKKELPTGCFFADCYVTPDARGRYYEGPDNYSTNSTSWSKPILFYPDGTTSTATILIKNDASRCIELHLRGLTGGISVGKAGADSLYEGDLDASVTRKTF